MIPKEYYFKLIILIAPIFSSITALLTVWFSFVKSPSQQGKIKKYLLLYFICAFISWAGLSFYYILPGLFAVLNSLFLLTFILIQIFFYAFVFSLTKTQNDEQFSRGHYIAPLTFFLTLSLLMLTTPFSKQVELVAKFGVYSGQPLFFYWLSNNKMAIRLIFTLVYTGLSFYRLRRFRKVIVDYSANEDRSNLNWVTTILFLSLILIIIPLVGLINKAHYLSTWFTAIPIAILIIQYAYLSFHIVSRNYIVISPDYEKKIEHEIGSAADYKELFLASDMKKQALTPEKFEAYINGQKPYLNPELKITDLVNQLGINRTYISSFINSHYSVNFSRYINLCRVEEYNRICSNPDNEVKSKQELAEMAGFNSYKSFMRFKNSL
ncbi:MAG: hypothetical protein AB7S48_00090 [Bacteroidales bacterium]